MEYGYPTGGKLRLSVESGHACYGARTGREATRLIPKGAPLIACLLVLLSREGARRTRIGKRFDVPGIALEVPPDKPQISGLYAQSRGCASFVTVKIPENTMVRSGDTSHNPKNRLQMGAE